MMKTWDEVAEMHDLQSAEKGDWNEDDKYLLYCYWGSGHNMSTIKDEAEIACAIKEKSEAYYDEDWEQVFYDKEGNELDIQYDVVIKSINKKR